MWVVCNLYIRDDCTNARRDASNATNAKLERLDTSSLDPLSTKRSGKTKEALKNRITPSWRRRSRSRFAWRSPRASTFDAASAPSGSL